jgi:hypothetical protein
MFRSMRTIKRRHEKYAEFHVKHGRTSPK